MKKFLVVLFTLLLLPVVSLAKYVAVLETISDKDLLTLQERSMRFDVVMSFAVAPEEGVATLTKEVGEAFPGYDVHIAPDVDLS